MSVYVFVDYLVPDVCYDRLCIKMVSKILIKSVHKETEGRLCDRAVSLDTLLGHSGLSFRGHRMKATSCVLLKANKPQQLGPQHSCSCHIETARTGRSLETATKLCHSLSSFSV